MKKRQKQNRKFINRFVGQCTDYRNRRSGNRGSRITNRIIRRKLRKELKKEVEEYIAG